MLRTTLLCLVTIAIAPAGELSAQSRSEEKNRRALAEIRKGPDGLHKTLATGRFKIGSSLDDVTTAYKPVKVFEHDGFTTAVYTPFGAPFHRSMSHTRVVAQKGRLVYADIISDVWTPTFFSSFTEDEQRFYTGSYHKAWHSYMTVLNQRYLHGMAAKAVAGFAAAVAHALDE